MFVGVRNGASRCSFSKPADIHGKIAVAAGSTAGGSGARPLKRHEERRDPRTSAFSGLVWFGGMDSARVQSELRYSGEHADVIAATRCRRGHYTEILLFQLIDGEGL